MTDEVRCKMFESGLTTKAVGKGTGLGMAICGIFPIDITSIGKMPHTVGVSPKGAMPFGETPTFARQIVEEKHGGTITCNSQLGKGTEFIIAIPIE